MLFPYNSSWALIEVNTLYISSYTADFLQISIAMGILTPIPDTVVLRALICRQVKLITNGTVAKIYVYLVQ